MAKKSFTSILNKQPTAPLPVVPAAVEEAPAEPAKRKPGAGRKRLIDTDFRKVLVQVRPATYDLMQRMVDNRTDGATSQREVVEVWAAFYQKHNPKA